MPIISIEGNIGSGKSSILERIHQRAIEQDIKTVHVIPESLDIWDRIKEGEKSIFQLFGEDRNKHAMSFQVLTFLTITYSMMSNLKKLQNNETIIIERSPISNIMVFAEMLYDDKIIGDIEWSILKYMANGMMMPVDKLVYLRTSPDVCMERVSYRDREGEQYIQLPYLEKIHNKHERWLDTIAHQTIETDEEIQAFIDGLF